MRSDTGEPSSDSRGILEATAIPYLPAMPLEPSHKTWDPAEPVQAVASGSKWGFYFLIEKGSMKNRQQPSTLAAHCRRRQPVGTAAKQPFAGRKEVGQKQPKGLLPGSAPPLLGSHPRKTAARLKKKKAFTVAVIQGHGDNLHFPNNPIILSHLYTTESPGKIRSQPSASPIILAAVTHRGALRDFDMQMNHWISHQRRLRLPACGASHAQGPLRHEADSPPPPGLHVSERKSPLSFPGAGGLRHTASPRAPGRRPVAYGRDVGGEGRRAAGRTQRLPWAQGKLKEEGAKSRPSALPVLRISLHISRYLGSF